MDSQPDTPSTWSLGHTPNITFNVISCLAFLTLNYILEKHEVTNLKTMTLFDNLYMNKEINVSFS